MPMRAATRPVWGILFVDEDLTQEQFSFPVACLLVEHCDPTGEKRVLIQKRRKPGTEYDGLWEIPQGRVRRGESFLDAAQRELLEETGLTLTTLKATHRRSSLRIADSSIESFAPFMCVTDLEHNYVGIAVIVSSSGDLMLSKEADSHKWVGRDEVLTLLSGSLVFPLDVPLLRAYFEL